MAAQNASMFSFPHAAILRVSFILILLVLLSNYLFLFSVSIRRTIERNDTLSNAQQQPWEHPSNGDEHGTWIGNTWIPPAGTKSYSPAEIRSVFQNHSVLWIGDSTIRRAYATLFGILNGTERHVPVDAMDAPNIIDVNRYGSRYGSRFQEVCNKPNTTICRHVPNATNAEKSSYDYQSTSCLRDVREFTNNALETMHTGGTRDYSLLVVGVGVWEIVRIADCSEGGDSSSYPNATYAKLQKTVEALCKLQGPNLKIVWRTSGFDSNHVSGNEVLKEINKRAMDQIDVFNSMHPESNITYIDWGAEIWPRSNGKDRINGDLRSHYGLEARLLLIQLLMNSLTDNAF